MMGDQPDFTDEDIAILDSIWDEREAAKKKD